MCCVWLSFFVFCFLFFTMKNGRTGRGRGREGGRGSEGERELERVRESERQTERERESARGRSLFSSSATGVLCKRCRWNLVALTWLAGAHWTQWSRPCSPLACSVDPPGRPQQTVDVPVPKVELAEPSGEAGSSQSRANDTTIAATVTVAKSVGEARFPGFAKYSATSDSEFAEFSACWRRRRFRGGFLGLVR